MTLKRKTSKRKPASKPTRRRRARPLTAPELVFPPGSFLPAPARDIRTFWQKCVDFLQGKP